LIRVEEAVFVRDVEDLAKESRILCDCSKRIVADDKNGGREFLFHVFVLFLIMFIF
jgi:hypothetical protein